MASMAFTARAGSSNTSQPSASYSRTLFGASMDITQSRSGYFARTARICSCRMGPTLLPAATWDQNAMMEG